MTLQRKSTDAPAATILARLATRHDNDKWLNDTIFNSLPGQTERANAGRTARTRPSRRAYVLPDLSAFLPGNSWNMATFEIAK
jgi:hypothetical protein